MVRIILDFLSPGDRTKHRTQYPVAQAIPCNTSQSLLQNLSQIRSDNEAVIVQILAHGSTDGSGLGNAIGERVFWQQILNALSGARTEYYVRLNLLLPCFSHTIEPYLRDCAIDCVWVNTSGANDEFSASVSSNVHNYFQDFIDEEIDGLVETRYREFTHPYQAQSAN